MCLNVLCRFDDTLPVDGNNAFLEHVGKSAFKAMTDKHILPQGWQELNVVNLAKGLALNKIKYQKLLSKDDQDPQAAACIRQRNARAMAALEASVDKVFSDEAERAGLLAVCPFQGEVHCR